MLTIKSKFMKHLLIPILMVFTLIPSILTGQDIKIKLIDNSDLVKFANDSKIIAQRKNDYFSSIKIILLGNLPGSAGYPNGEITENIFVAVSEYDELPVQNLFCISEFYNPKFVRWENEKDETIDFIISYGPIDQPKIQRFEISIDTVKLK
jgi:hypothetical protein